MPDFLYPTCKITADEFNQRHWTNKESLNSIARTLGIFPSTLWHHALRNGLTTRSARATHDLAVESGMRRTHSANYDLFKTWSPSMAWALGLIASDGNIERSLARISFSSKDYELAEKLRAVFEYTGPITPIKATGNFVLRISNQRLAQSLVDLGLEPAGSMTLRMPIVPSEHLHHFLRGFFDGDGCASVKGRDSTRKPQLTATFYCPSKPFLDVLETMLLARGIQCWPETVHHKDGIRKPMPITYMSGYNAIQLFHFMYDGVPESLYLQRKYDVFTDYIAKYGYRYANGPIYDLSHVGCQVEGCDLPHRARGYCLKHYNQQYHERYKAKAKPVCTVPGCNRHARTQSSGLCGMHYQREYLARKATH